MLKIRRISMSWFIWILALSSFSLAASEDYKPNSKEFNQQVNEVYSKIIYFDTLSIEDSLTYYINLGYSKFKDLDLNKIKSKETQLALARIYYGYGEVNFSTNNTFESLNGYEKAADIFKRYDIKDKYADCLTSIATNYSKVGKEPKSLDLMQRATSIYIDLKDSVGMMVGYRSIGLLYKRQKDYVRAHEYLKKALMVSKNTKDVNATIHLLIPLAGMKNRFGKPDEALVLYSEALDLLNGTDNDLTKATVYSNLAEFYKNNQELDSAIIYIDKAKELIDKTDSDYKRSYLWLNYCDYYYLKEDYKQAVLYGEKALRLSEQIKDKRAEFVTLNILLKVYEELDDPDQLAIYQKRVIKHLNEHKDQLNEQINKLETVRFKIEKQKILSENKQAKLLLNQEYKNQKRNYYYILIVSLFTILLTFSLIIFFRLRRTRKYNKIITKQSEERKLLLQEVHHRVKNNFQIVSSILRLQSYSFDNEVLRENFEEAVNRINAMAIVHNVIYRQEKFKDIDAKNYLERLVESLHKTGDSRISISIDSEEIPFKIETLINLGIALNELITNSFKHAFVKSSVDPKIKISLFRVGDKTFELSYKDNGIGLSEESYKSNFGMELIDTIISNYDGEVVYGSEQDWNTVFNITFKEE